MTTVSQLQEATAEYFDRYLSKDLNLSPAWSGPKKLEGANGLAPNGDMSGCYALLSGDEVIYIGLDRSWKKGRYQENALDARIRAHVLLVDKATKAYITRKRSRELNAPLINI